VLLTGSNQGTIHPHRRDLPTETLHATESRESKRREKKTAAPAQVVKDGHPGSS